MSPIPPGEYMRDSTRPRGAGPAVQATERLQTADRAKRPRRGLRSCSRARDQVRILVDSAHQSVDEGSDVAAEEAREVVDPPLAPDRLGERPTGPLRRAARSRARRSGLVK